MTTIFRTILIFDKIGIIYERITKIDEEDIATEAIQDVTLQNIHHDMHEENFLSDIWQHVINGKIPTLYSLCSAKIFQQCCAGDTCYPLCDNIENGCTHCCLCRKILWDEKNERTYTYGNYYEITWCMIKHALKEVKVSNKRLFLGKQSNPINNISVFEALMDKPNDICFEQRFIFDLFEQVSRSHQQNIQKLNLPKQIERYLLFPSNVIFKYEKYQNIDKKEFCLYFPWIMEQYEIQAETNENNL